MGKKVGCNFQDVNLIRDWAAAGKTAAQISDLIGVEVANVEMNMPAVDKPKAKPKAKKKEEVAPVVNESNDTE